MIEVHYHLLYGVDDGPKDLASTLAMAELSISEGTTHIVATPHANYAYAFDPARNQERLAELQERLAGRITLGLGCDFHLSHDNVVDALVKPAKYSINGGRYLLVELPDFVLSPRTSELLYDFILRGSIPIVTHPERNSLIAAKPEIMKPWIRSGCIVQVTAASLTGQFGKVAKAASEGLLERNWVHLIASDAHSTKGRPPAMKAAFELLKKNYGIETATRLCISNPRAIFDDQPLPAQPEPKGLDDSALIQPRAIWRRLFSR
jgi:protein-tyrosine phosphatase